MPMSTITSIAKPPHSHHVKGDAKKPMHWLTLIVLCLLLSPAYVHAAGTNITVARVTRASNLDQLQYVMSHQCSEVFDQGAGAGFGLKRCALRCTSSMKMKKSNWMKYLYTGEQVS